MNHAELCHQAFYYLNSFKRHRALEQIRKNEGKESEATYNQLKQYQFIDALELALRAIQKSVRDGQVEDTVDTEL